MTKLSGVMTALVTPMREGAVDYDALRASAEVQIAAGIASLIPAGSTGEGATLSDPEHEAVVKAVADVTAGRVPVIAGVGARSTWGAIGQARAAQRAGASHLLVVTPAYNKPTQAGLVAHFRAVADAVPLPIVVYNVPGRTAVDLKPETVAELAPDPRFVAIKEATGSLVRAAELRNLVGDSMALLSGDDFTYLGFAAQGGDGCISVLSNVAPEQLVALDRSLRGGDLAAAAALHHKLLPLMHALFVESNPIPIKTAVAWKGVIPSAELRLPLMPLTEAGGDQLAASLDAVGIGFERAPGPPSTVGPTGA